MLNFLTYDFMIYAIILSLILALSASLISPFLVLSHQSMIADGLSHVAFTGIIIGLLFFNEPIYLALPVVIVASFLITYLSSLKSISHDASIGVVSAFSLAVGLIIVSLSDGFNRSIESLLVGNIFTVAKIEVIIGGVLLLIITGFVLIFYRPLVSLTYDPNYAKVKGVKYNLLKYLLSAITASFIVIGVRSSGMLLISAFVIFPALISSQIARSFRQTITIGLIVSIFTVLVGILSSYFLDIPAGSSIVVIYTITLVVFIVIRKLLKDR